MACRTFIITRNAPEHFALIDAIQETGTLCGGILQTDECGYMSQEFMLPFKESARKSSERFFGIKFSHMSNVKTKALKHTEMNNAETLAFIESQSPDLLLMFDTEPLTDENLAAIKCEKWKLHRGFIEKFKGFQGNFWANYLLMPEYTSFTLHEMTDNSDTGDIIHQSTSALKKQDTFTDTEYKSLRSMLNDIPEIINMKNNSTLKTKRQAPEGIYFGQNAITKTHVNILCNTIGYKTALCVEESKRETKTPLLLRQV